MPTAKIVLIVSAWKGGLQSLKLAYSKGQEQVYILPKKGEDKENSETSVPQTQSMVLSRIKMRGILLT